MTAMVEVTKEDANNYRRVLKALGMEEEGDPVAVIEMLRSWEAESSARVTLLEQHLSAVLEIADTWQPDYASAMDRDTLKYAQACLDRKEPIQPPEAGDSIKREQQ